MAGLDLRLTLILTSGIFCASEKEMRQKEEKQDEEKKQKKRKEKIDKGNLGHDIQVPCSNGNSNSINNQNKAQKPIEA